ncbi:hypothetical protein A2870_03660 [Candidatus Curtissbacteria bacterium RIFCSPHIGHO2_01_FULL_41_11]|uniref:Type IV pilus modification protein PilV n=1 Tax=Candidatus Curtissbacteria bacterium RIFCSPHIGHO2_01_FULL_41_11 TaxID=1797711 RepID=A0A1F5G5U7_9BACT|nr:MAG: hypothetical protein A2870_03660 [Candidatus Curtissbacteria bacterium RIFCSPHIGHO2_01_FULL_41_11]
MKKKGQSLIEVVIALAVVVALAISLVTASLITQRTSRSASNNTEATKLALQTIEQIRALRDRKGFAELVNNTGLSCKRLLMPASDPKDWSLTATGTCPENITSTIFARAIFIEDDNPSSANRRKVTVTISWDESSGTQSVTNVTKLSNCVSSTEAC